MEKKRVCVCGEEGGGGGLGEEDIHHLYLFSLERVCIDLYLADRNGTRQGFRQMFVAKATVILCGIMS